MAKDLCYCRNLSIRITALPLVRLVTDDLAVIRKQTLAEAKICNHDVAGAVALHSLHPSSELRGSVLGLLDVDVGGGKDCQLIFLPPLIVSLI
jgi:hypothetical protein